MLSGARYLAFAKFTWQTTVIFPCVLVLTTLQAMIASRPGGP
jgi:hypothetical protein